MAKFVRGSIVVIPFPFSDLSGSKKRPAMVLAELAGDDVLLCQITSQPSRDSLAVPISHLDFLKGSLPVASYIRSTRIFTADKNIIIRTAGVVTPAIISAVT